MFCTRCGVGIPAGARFCSACGATVAASRADFAAASAASALAPAVSPPVPQRTEPERRGPIHHIESRSLGWWVGRWVGGHRGAWIAATLAACLLVLTALGTMTGTSRSTLIVGTSAIPATPAPAALVGRTDGTLRHVFGTALGRRDQLGYLQAHDTWCGWAGTSVVVPTTIHNAAGRSIRVSIAPTYSFAGGGARGRSETVTRVVPAHGTLNWLADAGHPRGGVQVDTQITVCDPSIRSTRWG